MIYLPHACAAFLRVKEKYGKYSNFYAMPILVNDVLYRTSEALYQAARFPENPDIQKLIVDCKSPMAAKMVSKKYASLTRTDWIDESGDGYRKAVMRWTLNTKLIRNLDEFSKALLESGKLPIVEISKNDAYWGAIPQSNGTLVGENNLGNMLTYLRDTLQFFSESTSVLPLDSTFKFFGKLPEAITL